MKLEKYTIYDNAKIIDALKKIDENKKGFLIVVDQNAKVKGTITDGDIRRAIISGKSIDDMIEGIYVFSCKMVDISSDFVDIIELFKNAPIKFVPIVDKEFKLINIITKGQIQSLLLQDIKEDLYYDFESLDENIIDYEIYPRPWGFYKTTVMNNYFQSKIISVKPKAELSLQSHEHREEHWIVAYGVGKVQIGESVVNVESGSNLYIPKGVMHRLINTSDKESLIVTEVQIGDYFGEDDIKRYEDKYGRV